MTVIVKPLLKIQTEIHFVLVIQLMPQLKNCILLIVIALPCYTSNTPYYNLV